MLERIVKKTNLNDVFIIIIASLAIVSFWRGTWNIMDKYIFPGNFLLSQLTTIAGGILLLVIISRIR